MYKSITLWLFKWARHGEGIGADAVDAWLSATGATVPHGWMRNHQQLIKPPFSPHDRQKVGTTIVTQCWNNSYPIVPTIVPLAVNKSGNYSYPEFPTGAGYPGFRWPIHTYIRCNTLHQHINQAIYI